MKSSIRAEETDLGKIDQTTTPYNETNIFQYDSKEYYLLIKANIKTTGTKIERQNTAINLITPKFSYSELEYDYNNLQIGKNKNKISLEIKEETIMEDYPIDIKKKIKTLLKEIRIQKIKEAEKSKDIIWTHSEIEENNNELPENDKEVNIDYPGYDNEVNNDLSDNDKESNNEIPENDKKRH